MIERFPKKNIFDNAYLLGVNAMECKKCGACCRLIVLQHSNPTKKSLEYYRARGWTFDPVNELVWIPSVCPHLLENNTCNIYENRPKQCRLYPTRTPGLVVPPGCAFEK
jgi:Fe-S-cluster containining protein